MPRQVNARDVVWYHGVNVGAPWVFTHSLITFEVNPCTAPAAPFSNLPLYRPKPLRGKGHLDQPTVPNNLRARFNLRKSSTRPRTPPSCARPPKRRSYGSEWFQLNCDEIELRAPWGATEIKHSLANVVVVRLRTEQNWPALQTTHKTPPAAGVRKHDLLNIPQQTERATRGSVKPPQHMDTNT